jgi:hypothetical protein
MIVFAVLFVLALVGMVLSEVFGKPDPQGDTIHM